MTPPTFREIPAHDRFPGRTALLLGGGKELSVAGTGEAVRAALVERVGKKDG